VAFTGAGPQHPAVRRRNYYVLPSTNFASARAGMTFGGWQIEAFVDNLADSHTVTNYNWSIDPGDGESRLQRQFTFRPRTIGLTFILQLQAG
jgi:hypothetical protein